MSLVYYTIATRNGNAGEVTVRSLAKRKSGAPTSETVKKFGSLIYGPLNALDLCESLVDALEHRRLVIKGQLKYEGARGSQLAETERAERANADVMKRAIEMAKHGDIPNTSADE